MSALTNQRSIFIYSFGSAPSEDENWTWFLQQHTNGDIGAFLNSGHAILRGDHEKGKDAAASIVFPNTAKESCSYHLLKNMHCMHLFSDGSDTTAWQRVADATTFAERELLWDHLQHYQPQQAAYLTAIDSQAIGHVKTTCPARAHFRMD